MRKIVSVLALVLGLVALMAWPFMASAQATQVTLMASDRSSFGAVPLPNFNGTITLPCSSSGNTGGQTIPPGVYEMRVANELSRVCEGSTCSSSTGAAYGPTESRFYRFTASGTKTCWSSSGSGVIQLTPVSF